MTLEGAKDAIIHTISGLSIHEGEYLSDISPKDRPWDVHKAQAQDLEEIYRLYQDTEKYADRIANCSGYLRFAYGPDPQGGVILRLKEARFCRLRHCPICQWRRSLMWMARFYEALPSITQQYCLCRWIYLTLTVKNCHIKDLRNTLKLMNIGWAKLIKRQNLKPWLIGWIRTTEVTRSKDGSAHPHFHILMLVKPSYFTGRYYLSKEKWAKLWQDVLDLDYEPIVWAEAVKDKHGNIATGDAIRHAVAETLKYSVKPQDLLADPDWLYELHKQVHHLRFVASGGVLKKALRLEQESNTDLLLADPSNNDLEDDGKRITFFWKHTERRYRRLKQVKIDS